MRPKHLAKVAAKSVFALIDPLFGPFPGPRILIYHQIGVNFGREMEVSIEAFHRHLDWMQSQGEIVDLESAIERRGEPDADKLFALTFDDGFGDVYHNAFPIMKERGIPFTLYLTTNPIETGEPLDPRYPEARPLTWDQVTEMIGTGLVTVGAHTHNHPDLRHVDTGRIVSEVQQSNSLISDRTGVEPRHFTYPWGRWAHAADRVVRERYESATVGSPREILEDSDLFMLGRIPIQRSDSARVFRRRLDTGLRTEAAIRRRIANYSGP